MPEGKPLPAAGMTITLAFRSQEMISDLFRICCAMKAKTVSDGVFLSGRTQSSVEDEDLAFHPLFRFATATVDREARRVHCSILGTGLSAATAVFVEGIGSVLLSGETEEAVRARLRLPARRQAAYPADAPWPLGDGEPGEKPRPGAVLPALESAADRLFTEPKRGQKPRTRAVLIVQDDRILLERYAPGFTRDMPLPGWSMGKSIVAVLVGVLETQGKLRREDPVRAPEWGDADDPRRALTVDRFLRMSSGLSWKEAYEKDPVTDVQRMLYLEPDMAAFAADKPAEAEADAEWKYSSGSTNIVCRFLRSAFPDLGSCLDFPHRELFSRIGMRSAVLATDATGTFIGSSYPYATARDYARFGLFCLHDGVWAGRRILKEGWMAYATTPTPKAPRGNYGASFWLNRGAAADPSDRPFPALPADLYYANGYQGQAIVVVPSRRLVAVRLGMSWTGQWGAEEFLKAVLDALPL
jgi:CubicO group peptidase (beta-lactamase class C family)